MAHQGGDVVAGHSKYRRQQRGFHVDVQAPSRGPCCGVYQGVHTTERVPRVGSAQFVCTSLGCAALLFFELWIVYSVRDPRPRVLATTLLPTTWNELG